MGSLGTARGARGSCNQPALPRGTRGLSASSAPGFPRGALAAQPATRTRPGRASVFGLRNGSFGANALYSAFQCRLPFLKQLDLEARS